MHASLACPSTGGTEIRRISSPDVTSSKASREERGFTRSQNDRLFPSIWNGTFVNCPRAGFVKASFPWTENSRPHADDGGAFLDRHFEIVAHPHGKLARGDTG